jgi:myo-inositol-1(or 4)-monophosphatase
VGEEEGGDLAAGTRWIIDPIDGTKSFVAGVPLYATLVSFEESFLPVAAACYFPALDEMLYADLEGGAFFNGRPCRVSSRTDLDRALVCVGNPQRFVSLGRLEGFLRLSAGVLDVRTWCDAYGHALVATGRVDAMIDPNISLWDVSALSLILKEAGGTFTDFDGRDTLVHPRENGKYDAISANGKLTQEVLGLFHP